MMKENNDEQFYRDTESIAFTRQSGMAIAGVHDAPGTFA
jgi:hypothetical protein